MTSFSAAPVGVQGWCCPSAAALPMGRAKGQRRGRAVVHTPRPGGVVCHQRQEGARRGVRGAAAGERGGARAVRAGATSANASGLESILPFMGTFPPEAAQEIAVPNVWPDDERVWVPQTDTVSFRPLCFNVSQGYYVNLLRVRQTGLLSRHRHPGPVHGFVLKGDWKYLEHDWEAHAGSYVFEPPGETHTLVVLPGCEEMVTLFHVSGALLYCDPDGTVTGYEDVFSKLEKAKEYYERVGLGADFVQQFVR